MEAGYAAAVVDKLDRSKDKHGPKMLPAENAFMAELVKAWYAMDDEG